jgi:hypothetical protein
VTLVQVVVVVVLIVAAIVVLVTVVPKVLSHPTVAADPSGKAHFKTEAIPTWEFDVQCHGSDTPTVESVNYMGTTSKGRKLDVAFDLLESKDCTTSTGRAGKDTSWSVRATKTYVSDLSNTGKPVTAGAEHIGTLDCPCSAPETRILYLEWKDVERVPYPRGESATYYNVDFKLTDSSTNQQLATWQAWIRVPGGHTHYGYVGGKQIIVDRSKCPGSLIECAKETSGIEFSARPDAGP